MREAIGAAGGENARVQLRLHCRCQARGREVVRLLEERSIERVRLVEDREDLERTVGEQSLHRDLETRDEALDEQVAPLLAVCLAREQTFDARACAQQLRTVVGADHPTAGRHRYRLDHAGELERVELPGQWLFEIEAPMARHRDTGARELRARQVLAPRQTRRLRRVVRQAECVRHCRSELGGGIVGTNDRGDWPGRHHREQACHGRVMVGEIDIDAIDAAGRDGMLAVRGEQQLHAQPGRGGDEGRDAIAAVRRDDQHACARHGLQRGVGGYLIHAVSGTAREGAWSGTNDGDITPPGAGPRAARDRVTCRGGRPAAPGRPAWFPAGPGTPRRPG